MKVPVMFPSELPRSLREADEHLASGRKRRAAKLFAEASSWIFDRRVHFDALNSPIAEHPEYYGALFGASEVMRTLSAPRGSSRPVVRSGDAGARPVRLLIVTWGNANFLQDLCDAMAASATARTRVLDLKSLESVATFAKIRRLAAQILGDRLELRILLEKELRPLLDWADVVFVDWCTVAPVLLTMLDPGDARLVLRLHSYEAFTAWPHLVDFSRMSDVVFVSEHLRDLTMAVVPALRADTAPRTHVLPLAMRLDSFVVPKQAPAMDRDPRLTLGLVGWSSVAKDPRWALRVIEALSERDNRYRLLLVGSPLNDASSEAAADYAETFLPELKRLRESGAVELREQTDDVPAALQEIGVILSSSVREGCHTAVMEGAASAAVPVVRDWPFFAGKPNGARTLFPTEWVVDSPEQAAERVLDVTATEERWRRFGRSAQEHAMSHWDWSVVRPMYDDLLLK